MSRSLRRLASHRRTPRGRPDLRGVCGCLALALVSCRAPDARVESEVLARLRAFEAAERTLDPETVLAFLSPEFTMLQDGERVGTEATVAQIRRALPALASFEPRFEEVEVIVLGPDAALTSMIFRDVVTDAEGVVSRARGPSTLLWRKCGGTWRIVFADSDHYRVDPDP